MQGWESPIKPKTPAPQYEPKNAEKGKIVEDQNGAFK